MDSQIELVVFDIAGTTVVDEDAVNHSFRAALEGAGLHVSAEAVNEVMGMQKPTAIRLLVERFGDSARHNPGAIHADFVARMIRHYSESPSVREVPGASETFVRLHTAGILVALDTGFSRDITEVILRRLGWDADGSVDAVCASDEVSQGRPHPDMIRHLMELLGVQDPARVAKVGDTPVDLHEGHNAGCGLVIGVTGGTHTRQQLEGHPHTHLIETVAELPGLLGL